MLTECPAAKDERRRMQLFAARSVFNTTVAVARRPASTAFLSGYVEFNIGLFPFDRMPVLDKVQPMTIYVR
jgi:hypothetical protein